MNTDELSIEIKGQAGDANAEVKSLIDNFKSLNSSVNQTFNSLSKYGSLESQLKKLNLPDLNSNFYKLKSSIRDATSETKTYKTETGQVVTVSKKIKNGLEEVRVKLKEVNDETKKSGKSFSDFSSNLIGSVVKLKVAFAAVKGIANKITDITHGATNYEEALNLFTVTMGSKAKEATEWVEKFSKALYLDDSNVMQYMGSLNSLIKGLGVGTDKSYLMSKNLTQLVYDLASFKNIDIETSFRKIQSAISGEIEPLRNVGVALSQNTLQELTDKLSANLDENTLQELANEQGIKKRVAAMSEAEKAQLRYIQILRSTTEWQGDMGRTLISPANALRVLAQQFTLLGRSIGRIFIPIVMKVIPYIMALTQALTALANRIASLFGYKITDIDYSSLKDMTVDVSDGIEDIGDSAAKTTKKLNTMLAPFDELNVVQNQNEKTGGGSGGVSGSGGDLGLDLPEYDALAGLTDEFDKKLEKIKSTIRSIGDVFGEVGEIIKGIWQTEDVQSFVNFTMSYGQLMYDYWSTLGSNLVTNLQTTWDGIKENVGYALDDTSLLWTMFWNDLADGIDKWGPEIVKKVSKVFDSVWKDAFDPSIKLLTQIWSDFTSSIVDLWDEYGEPIVDEVGRAISNLVTYWQKLWDDILKPIIQPFLETLSSLWNDHLKGLVEEVGKFIGELVSDALKIYNYVIAPIMGWILDKLAPAFRIIGNVVSTVAGSIVGFIVDMAKSVIKRIRGIVEFITGVFTGDWKKAWQGVKDIFSSVVEGFANIFKFPINHIIDGINLFIKELNKIKIADWVPGVGGKGFNLKPLKKLADGGFVEEGEIFMAREAGPEMVGRIGNKTAVANNDQITSSITNALVTALSGMNFGRGQGTTVVNIGGRKVYEGIGDYVDSENDRYGTNYVRV